MTTNTATRMDVERLIRAATSSLVRVQPTNGSYFVNLPILYPDGSFVTVKIDALGSGFRVSDNGFAWREADDVGAARSFKRTAKRFAEEYDVDVGDRAIFVDVSAQQIERAICEVASVSWRVADHICSRAFDEDEAVLADELSARLVKIFGAASVKGGASIRGASATDWPVSAIVASQRHATVFQAVSNHPASIYKAATAFRDLSGLSSAPRLVAFVRDKNTLGTKISLLAPSEVIEETQTDTLIERAAA